MRLGRTENKEVELYSVVAIYCVYSVVAIAPTSGQILFPRPRMSELRNNIQPL